MTEGWGEPERVGDGGEELLVRREGREYRTDRSGAGEG